MFCLPYVIAVGFLLGMAGVLCERLMPASMSRRWMWCAIIAASVALPGYYRYHHAFALAGTFEGALIAADPALLGRIRAVDEVIGRAWVFVTVGLGSWALVSAGWVSHVVRASRVRLRGSAPAAIDGVPVVITESLGPATVGILRSRVVLPRWVLALPDAQRQYIVRHEDEHRRSHDAALLFLGALAVILLPWNVALWWQVRRLSLAVEMDCDRRVVARLGNAHAYGSLLLKVAEASSRGPRLQPALLGATGMLEQRLSVLLAPAPLHLFQRVVLPIAASLLLLLVLTMPHPVMSTHAHAGASTTASSSPVSSR